MKFGILTFHFALNYGAMLQAFALKKKIIENGFECEIINYIPEHMATTANINPFKTDLSVAKKIKSLIKLPLRYLTLLSFKKFSVKYLGVFQDDGSRRHQFSIPDDITDVVVGSDQVWNGDITDNDPSYFLKPYLGKVNCYSYAASIGGENPTGRVNEYFIKYLSKFKSISVRESNLQDYLIDELSIVSEHVLDPVFLIDEKEWSKIGTKPKSVPERFVLYYSLEKNETLTKQCVALSMETGLPIVSVHPFARCFIKGSIPLYRTGPLEFLWLIENAEFVCTNSFHAVAFSSIFKKRLIYRNHSTLGSRVDSLLNLFNLSIDDMIISENSNKIEIINFDKTDNAEMKAMIENSTDFIKRMHQ